MQSQEQVGAPDPVGGDGLDGVGDPILELEGIASQGRAGTGERRHDPRLPVRDEGGLLRGARFGRSDGRLQRWLRGRSGRLDRFDDDRPALLADLHGSLRESGPGAWNGFHQIYTVARRERDSTKLRVIEPAREPG
jgi:hypothetical protein